ncbi:MAG TPA: hypothetical protein VHS09_09815 [Polyangiaceae bacterium]|nr:hypothetical protein [Polyangiaceae bacterium]
MIRRVAALVLGGALFAAWGCGARTGLDEADLGGGAGGSGASGSSGAGSGSGSGGSGSGSSGSGSGGLMPGCAGGVVTLYTGPALPSGGAQGPGALAVDSAAVYWTAPPTTEALGGAVMSVPSCGGAASTLASPDASTSQVNLGALAVAGSNVYWATQGDTSPSPDGQVMRVPAAGGASSVVVKDQLPVALTADATHLYWTDDHSGAVWRAPLAGGVPSQLGVGLGFGGVEVGSIAVDASSVYFYSTQQGIQSVPLSGGPTTSPTQLLQIDSAHGDSLYGLAASGGRIYWSDGLLQNGTVQSLPTGGGAPTTLVSASPTDVVGDIAVDGVSVYWIGAHCTSALASSCTGKLTRVPAAGGPPTVVASGWPSGDALGVLAVDATSVYFTAGNTILKATPK